jgi:DNA-binding IclR family transcriptional regulator
LRKEQPSIIQALIKGLNIMDCFEADSEELGVQEISKKVDLPEATVYRMLNTLEYKGYILQNKETKKYRLGLKYLNIERKIKNIIIWKEKAKELMRDLSEKCGETVNLAIREEDKIVYIDKIDSHNILRPNFKIGVRYPSYCTGLGRVLLSDLPEETLNTMFFTPLKPLTPYTITDLEEIKKQLKKIRKEGYAIDNEEFCLGIRCVAAPIKSFGNNTVAAISVSIPTIRVDDEKLNFIKDLVIKTAKQISAELNF